MLDWYFCDGGAETGPVGQDQAIAFLQTRDPDRIHVWREDFDEWMLLRDVPELAAAVRAEAVAPVPAAVCAPKARAATRARRRVAAKGAFKFAWAQIGALAGAVICAADLLFAWRGEKFATWDNIAGLAQ